MQAFEDVGEIHGVKLLRKRKQPLILTRRYSQLKSLEAA